MKVGVVGTGKMGEYHVQTYLSLQEHCDFVGIFDQDVERASMVASKYNVRPFSSLESLLEAVDAVSIVVPTKFHYEIALSCIKHHVHMLLEKPITNTVDEARRLIQQLEKQTLKVQIGHIELYNPLVQLLLEELKGEKIIEIVHERMGPSDKRVKNVNVVKDLMIHDIYILQELLKEKIPEWKAYGKKENQIPNHAVFLGKSTSGVTVHLTASFHSKEKRRIIRVLTDRAFFEADLLKGELVITRNMMEETNQHPIPLKETIQVDETIQPLYLQLLDFLNCIKFNNIPFISAEDGMKTLYLTDKISESIIHAKG